MKRGDVVIADFPFQDVPGSKIRPAVVVQNDADNGTQVNTILVMITGS
jgi:mRNA interferase MazF